CRECNTITEILVGVGRDKTEIKCASCGSFNVEKIISASYIRSGVHSSGSQDGRTCCGREERCATPPCSVSGACVR
ncbi:MAG: hypothetical protein JW774_13800, partial [Candidatus Aureabacteria bacterium]|nr:hypothetical protein [Candidatus Auribacterota bacterium]